MNLLNKTKVYLSGPMEFTQDGESWRNFTRDSLDRIGVLVIEITSMPKDLKYLPR